VYAIAAAPVVLSGSAAFLGYFTLNDAAVHFALIDQLLAHGRDLSGLASSSYLGILHNYLSTSYPVGSQVALGAVRPLVGADVAWIFQPYLAVIVSLGAVALFELLDGVVRSRPLRALCAFVAAQPGLLYAFYLEGSIKEVATAWIVTVTVVLVVATLRASGGVRRVLPLGVAVLAGLDLLELAIAPWLAVPLATFVVVVAWRARHLLQRAANARLALAAGGALIVAAVLAAPIVTRASSFLKTAEAVLTKPGDLGNLAEPLQRWELFGIWPSGDFRFPVTTHYRTTYALIGLSVASACLGALWVWRRRAVAPLLLIAGNTVAAIFLLKRGSPYASAKVMAIFSVTVVLSAMLGAAALYDWGHRLEAWVLAAVLAGAVLWTNALGYHESSVAPRDRLGELASIGGRFAGLGPALYNQSDEFAIHFLRREDPFDVAFSPPPARAGLAPRTPGQSRRPWDPDEIAPSYLQQFPLLVLGRSPRISRPPANYQLVYEGRYYQVWRRTAAPTVLAHVPLGGPLQPAAVPSCRSVLAIATRAARERAHLAYVARPLVPVLVPTQAERPPNWGEVEGDPTELIPRQQRGSVVGSIVVPRAGLFQVWLEGSFGQRMSVRLAGRRVGSVAYELGPPGQFVRIAQVSLPRGTVAVQITWPGSGLDPGEEGEDRRLGPLMLVPSGATADVALADPANARSLCGRSLDWIEIVR
jgi:hypothetical protein